MGSTDSVQNGDSGVTVAEWPGWGGLRFSLKYKADGYWAVSRRALLLMPERSLLTGRDLVCRRRSKATSAVSLKSSGIHIHGHVLLVN